MLVTPNRLTAIRIILSILCVILLFSHRSLAIDLITTILFSLGCFTDWLDGYIARTKSMITKAGKIVDPIADKLLILGIMAGFVHYDLYPVEWVIFIGVREFLVTIWRLCLLREGKVLPAEWAGKVKVGFQVGSIYATFVYLIASDAGLFGPSFAIVLLGLECINYLGIFLATLVTVTSGMLFFHRLHWSPLWGVWCRLNMNRLAHWLATCGPVGKSRVAPGTLGSFLAIPLIVSFGITMPVTYVALTVVLVLVAIWASGATSRELGVHDPPSVVLDEVCGVLVSFICLPIRWQTLISGFILFRALDVWKPLPIRELERLPGGFGIVLDDVMAGIYANLLLQGLVHYAKL